MHRLDTAQVARACRIFLDLAYPGGLEAIPVQARLYFELPPDRPIGEFFSPLQAPTEVVEVLRDKEGAFKGFSLRLGCAGFPHLKMLMNLMVHPRQDLWVFGVDTHDHFSRLHYRAPVDHPEAKRWLALQEANQMLKERIEAAWQEAQLPTFLTVLIDDLEIVMAK